MLNETRSCYWISRHMSPAFCTTGQDRQMNCQVRNAIASLLVAKQRQCVQKVSPSRQKIFSGCIFFLPACVFDGIDRFSHAGVAELVDALDSGSSIRKDVLVRFQSSAPRQKMRVTGNRDSLFFALIFLQLCHPPLRQLDHNPAWQNRPR